MIDILSILKIKSIITQYVSVCARLQIKVLCVHLSLHHEHDIRPV